MSCQSQSKLKKHKLKHSINQNSNTNYPYYFHSPPNNSIVNHITVSRTAEGKRFEGASVHTYRFSPLEGEKGTSFEMKCLSDTGCSRTIIAKNIVDKFGYPILPNVNNDRLQTANKQEMRVNGIVVVEGSWIRGDNSKMFDCLVSDELDNEIIVSWHDAEGTGTIQIAKEIGEYVKSISNAIDQPSKDELKRVLDSWFQKYPCLSDKLSAEPMAGEPMRINITKGANPRKYYTPVTVPYHYKKEAKELIDGLVADGIIRPLADSKAPEFCARAFFVPKPGGKGLRLVVDNSDINKFIERPIHPFTAGNELLRQIPHNAACFMKLDALWGFYQILLDEDSRHITTFICEWGTFEFCRAPMGLNCSGDEFCKRSDKALNGLEGVMKLIDDILIYAENYEQLFQRAEAVLQRCTEHNITLSRKKIEIGSKVTFAGFDVSARGHSPTKDRIKAITEFKAPKNVSGVRSFLGLAQGLAHFVPDFAQVCVPINRLLRKNTVWIWGPPQIDAFEKIKQILTSDLVLRNFNPDFKTQVITDASRDGIGFALLQKDPKDDQWHLVQCGSRALNGPESRYAVCEIEGLGVLYALQKCRHFLVGMEKFDVITDHKSLRGVFQKPIFQVDNVRLRRFRERLQEYNFEVTWLAGKLNRIADCLSRFPVSPAAGLDDEDGSLVACVCSAVFSDGSVPIISQVCVAANPNEDHPDPLLQPIIEAANNDPEYQALIEGLRHHTKLNELGHEHPAQAYSQVWKNLEVHNLGLVVYNKERIVVPRIYRKTLLDKLHAAHCGEPKENQRGRRDYWWPHFARSIEENVRSCEKCVEFLPSLPQQPIVNRNEATAPVKVMGTDLFQSGSKDYIVFVDQFSGYPWCKKLSSTTSGAIIEVMRELFAEVGNPEWLIRDNGPQLASTETSRFLEGRGIQSDPSSPYYPQSNGLSEAAVKSVKYLLEKCDRVWSKFQDALQHWRDTPNDSGKTPAEIYFGRRIRTSLPLLPGKTELNLEGAIEGGAARKKNRSVAYAKRSSRVLKDFEAGDRVYVQSPNGKKRWKDKGTVISARHDGRSYQVTIDGKGKRFVNRRHLRPVFKRSDVTEDTPSVPDVWISAEPITTEISEEESDDEFNEWDELVQAYPEAPVIPPAAPAAPAETELVPELRRSTRVRRAPECHSCADCRVIRTLQDQCLTCHPIHPQQNGRATSQTPTPCRGGESVGVNQHQTGRRQ